MSEFPLHYTSFLCCYLMFICHTSLWKIEGEYNYVLELQNVIGWNLLVHAGWVGVERERGHVCDNRVELVPRSFIGWIRVEPKTEGHVNIHWFLELVIWCLILVISIKCQNDLHFRVSCKV
jgi:hypothetical protein